MTEEKTISPLVGMYFVEAAADHKSLRIGQITRDIVNGLYYLIRLSPAPGDHLGFIPPNEVVSIMNFNERCNHCGERLWNLFETIEDRDRYVTINTAMVADAGPGAGPSPESRGLN